MEFRPADENDLPFLKEMYVKIVKRMEAQGVIIWHDGYPYPVFLEEIPHKELYVMTDNGEIVSAISILNDHAGASAVGWREPDAPATYMSRLGVSVDRQREGLSRKTLNFALALAKSRGSRYLRLFAVDSNYPAVNMYEKYGFIKAGGMFVEYLDNGEVSREYGFEKPVDEKI